MTLSIQRDRHGSDWPLGLLLSVTPGVPVPVMSLVDPAAVNDPNSPTSQSSGEYTIIAQQIQFQAVRLGVGGHGLQPNVGNIYVMRAGIPPAPGNRDDSGSIVAVLFPGQTFFIAAAPMNMDVLNPYRYFIDADNAGDGALVTLYIG